MRVTCKVFFPIQDEPTENGFKLDNSHFWKLAYNCLRNVRFKDN
jgi:hypothetical protein